MLQCVQVEKKSNKEIQSNIYERMRKVKKSIFRVQNTIKLKLFKMINKSGEEFINSLPDALEPKDVIDIMPIGKTKVYQLLRQGRLPGHKIDGQWIIPKLLFLQWYYFGEFETKDIVKKVI